MDLLQVVKMKVGSVVETNPQVTVRGMGFDRNLGSLEITLRMRDHLARTFNAQKKTPNNVLENPRSMAKLHKEAERVKKILSANTEAYAQVTALLATCYLFHQPCHQHGMPDAVLVYTVEPRHYSH